MYCVDGINTMNVFLCTSSPTNNIIHVLLQSDGLIAINIVYYICRNEISMLEKALIGTVLVVFSI